MWSVSVLVHCVSLFPLVYVCHQSQWCSLVRARWLSWTIYVQVTEHITMTCLQGKKANHSPIYPVRLENIYWANTLPSPGLVFCSYWGVNHLAYWAGTRQSSIVLILITSYALKMLFTHQNLHVISQPYFYFEIILIIIFLYGDTNLFTIKLMYLGSFTQVSKTLCLDVYS